MTSYGQLRFLLSKDLPGVDPDKLDGAINDRYREILSKIDWRRVRVPGIVQTVAAFQPGTVQATNGSNAIALTGGAFTSTMSGQRIRIDSRDEYYTFTYVDATHATIDRPYESPTNATAGFVVWQPIYTLPVGAEDMEDPCLETIARPLSRMSQSDLRLFAPNRSAIGAPQIVAPYSDDSSTPSNSRVEFYPGPDSLYSIQFWYTPDCTLFGPDDTASILPAWIDEGCIKAGVRADLAPDIATSQRWEVRFASLLKDMIDRHSRQGGAKVIRMPQVFTRHRLLRALKNRPIPIQLP